MSGLEGDGRQAFRKARRAGFRAAKDGAVTRQSYKERGLQNKWKGEENPPFPHVLIYFIRALLCAKFMHVFICL